MYHRKRPFVQARQRLAPVASARNTAAMLPPGVATRLGPALAARAERCIRRSPALADELANVVRRAELQGAGPEELALALGIVLALRDPSEPVAEEP
ncbi:MAG TPA: hypothetical protein VKY73_13335 [Polyangiaceae bacterium]|nr:hypothetical protein [Polyangiaceae bacterium]